MTHNDQFRIEGEALLAGAASTSHAIFGNFALSNAADGHVEQVALLRSMNTIELYRRTRISAGSGPPGGPAKTSLELVCKYFVPNTRILDMAKVTIDVRQSIFEPASQIVARRR